MPSTFWGLIVIESARSSPATRKRCAGTRPKTAPIAPSTCSHKPRLEQRSAIASRGSTAPRTVVPAVATTAITGWPARSNRSSSCSRAWGSKRPAPSTAIGQRASGGRPITASALAIETWASALATTTARLSVAKPRLRRAATRAIRLERVPPLAPKPPLPGGMPSWPANQAVRLRSSRVRLGESSSASRLLLRPAQISSAAMEAARGGGSRWARAPGWLGL